MTAVNMLVQPRARAGYVIADCAHLDMAGRLQSVGSKIIHGNGSFPWAAGVTGNVHPETILGSIGAAGPVNFKQLAKRLPGAMRDAIGDTSSAQYAPSSAFVLGLKGVAWDRKESKPIGFVIFSDSSLMPGAEPFTFYTCAWNATVGDDTFPGDAATDPARYDPEVDGLATVHSQRVAGATSLVPGLAADVRHAVGGEVHMARVTKRGVSMWLLGHWPDRIGERIDPSLPVIPA